jgi:4'-phosphopantetheinyl transferase
VVAPKESEVHIWSVDLSTAEGAEIKTDVLSPEERARFAALDAADRQAATLTRVALRELLGDYVGIDPADIELAAGTTKPALAAGELEFNVAHSDGLALIAVAMVAVGVDIECVEPIAGDEFTDLVEFVLTARERDELEHLPESERVGAYYRVWTRKEAYVKATGEGIAGRPLPEVVVGVTEPALVAVVDIAEAALREWSVRDVDVPANYVASVVVRHPDPRLTVRRWSG